MWFCGGKISVSVCVSFYGGFSSITSLSTFCAVPTARAAGKDLV